MLKTVARNLGASWLGHLAALIVGIISLPIVLDRLGKEGYGLWVTIASIIAYSELLHGGMGQALVRCLAVRISRGDPKSCNVYLSFGVYAFVAVILLTAVLVGLVAVVVVPLLEASTHLASLLPLVVLLVGLDTIVAFAAIPFGAVLWAHERFDLINATIIGTRITYLAAIVIFLGGDRAIVMIAVMLLIIDLVSNMVTVALAFWVMPSLRLVPLRKTKSAAPEVWRFTKWLFGKLLAKRIILQSDLIVLAIVRGPVAVATYAIAGSLVQHTQNLIERFEVTIPTASQLHGKGDDAGLESLLLITGKVGTMVAVCATVYFAVFGKQLIGVWVGADFVPAFTFLAILLVALVAKAPHVVSQSVLFGRGEVRFPTILGLVEAVLNLSLSIVLGLRYGGVGIAIGTAVPAVLLWFAYFPRSAARLLGVSWGRFMATIYLLPLRAGLVPVAVLVLLKNFWELDHFVELALLVPITGLVSAVSFYVFGFTADERRLSRQFLQGAWGKAVLSMRPVE